ncbi:MAG TPA: CotH kinase family protein [Candidatus Limnocylindria bacterium]|jgi:hypothetical protein|nr:CotH kinase family protein [Candidatus Limnocylindria bacterium]
MRWQRWLSGWLAAALTALVCGPELAAEVAPVQTVSTNKPAPKPTVKTLDDEEPDDKGHAAADAAAAAFFVGPIQRFEVQISSENMMSLRMQRRKPVSATLKVGGNVFTNIAVHVKGAAGSTRSVDDNPALTLSLDKWVPGQRYSGLTKFHLNNSVQDGSLLNESVAAFLYARAGVPTARSTHALVTLNGRDLGIYVFKEGYNRSFLRRQFGTSAGNLYDGGFLQDVDQDLERDVGDGEDTHEDLHKLAAATRIGNAAKRRAAMEKLVDVNRFITMAVIQGFTGDWDGYAQHHNNYRTFHNAATDKFTFIPHGMDQLFEDIYRDVAPGWEGLVADAIFNDPEWTQQFWTEMEKFVGPGLDEALKKHFADVHQRLDPVFAKRPADERWRRGQLVEKEHAVMARLAQVREQVARRPRPVKFGTDGTVALDHWEQHPGNGEVEFKIVPGEGKGQLLRLVAEQRSSAGSWRSRLHLFPGRYSYSARIKTARVDPYNVERMQGGAGIRISGSLPTSRFKGDTEWQTMTYEFEITDVRDVEFVAELRANVGEVYFDLGSMRLKKM